MGGWKIIAAIAFALGTSAGSALTWKVVQAKERAEFKRLLDEKDRAYALAMDVQRSYYAEKLRIAQNRVTVKEVTRYVADNRACDLSPSAVRMLDRARRGTVPDDTTGTAGTAAGPAASEGLPQRVEVLAHADCGERYREAQARIRAIRKAIGVE